MFVTTEGGSRVVTGALAGRSIFNRSTSFLPTWSGAVANLKLQIQFNFHPSEPRRLAARSSANRRPSFFLIDPARPVALLAGRQTQRFVAFFAGGRKLDRGSAGMQLLQPDQPVELPAPASGHKEIDIAIFIDIVGHEADV